MDRRELPTHFLVYPEWFGCDALLGEELARATVLDHAILGGDTMIAYAADFSRLGAGASPFAPPEGAALVDEVDVADLASEAAHGFALGDAWETDDVARELDADGPDARGAAPGARGWIDGGRLARARDSFAVTVPAGAGATFLVLRVAADEPVTLRVTSDGAEAGTIALPKTSWYEATIPLPSPGTAPASAPGVRRTIDVIALDRDGAPVPLLSRDHGPRFASFHYWLFAR